MCRDLRATFGENPGYDPKDLNPEVHYINPIPFIKEHKQILARLEHIITKDYLAIPDKYEKLIIALRTAQVVNEWDLDKKNSSFNDSLDAIRLSVKGYEIK